MSADDNWTRDMEHAHDGVLDVLTVSDTLTVNEAVCVLMTCAVNLLAVGEERSIPEAVAELARIATHARDAYVEAVAC